MRTYEVIVSRGRFNVRDSDNPDGFPVIMQHGWPESSYSWEPVCPFLSTKLRIIAPDLRGLGDSERTLKPELYQKSELAKDIIEIVDGLSIKEFFLVGHDWGGNVAQEIAFAIPSRVKRLVLMNFPILSNSEGNMEAMKVMQSKGSVALMYQYFQQQQGLPEAMIRGNEEVWIRWCFGKAGREGLMPEEAIREYVRCYKIENTPATGAYYYRNLKLDRKRWLELSGRKLHMPTLYIYGNQDKVIIPEYLNHIEDCFDQIDVKQIDAGHFVHEEEPEVVGRLLNEFLLRA
ncbi:MAG: alpha/beta hydrolase [Syntrophobacteraceae bacterium]|jgi:pimeloyl-ACP methyl ester carboxylesterase